MTKEEFKEKWSMQGCECGRLEYNHHIIEDLDSLLSSVAEEAWNAGFNAGWGTFDDYWNQQNKE